MLYSLEMGDDGSYIYDSVEMSEQPLAVLDGYLDSDNKIDYVFLFDRGASNVFSFSPSLDPIAEMEVGTDVFNVFFTDVDGDGISDLMYFSYDEELGNIVSFTIWDAETHTYQYIGDTNFGDLLQNYFPYDSPTASFISPIAGDFDGNGVVDIMVIITGEGNYQPESFIMYTR